MKFPFNGDQSQPPETMRYFNSTPKATTVGGNFVASTITSIPFPTQGTLTPALKPKVELGLTITYTVLYGILFTIVYIQLWMIWYYRHKRFSYQTVFLYLALIWSGLRVTLFAFYFNDCSRVNFFPFFTYWLMFCFPICLQFVILCLLVLFFAQVIQHMMSLIHLI